jgi:DNA transposition AAA+ family ATPase
VDNELLKQLEDDALIKKERIPEKITKEEIRRVADLVRQFLISRKIPQSSFAREIGVGTSRFNQFLNGKYKGNIADLINKSLQLMESYARKEKRVKNVPYIETTVAKSIAALITQTETYSDEEGKIGVIIGDGGHGKSVCLRKYAEANKNTVYVELDDAMTPTMFSAIAEALGIDSDGSIANITRRLIYNLVNRHVIIMLDEASGLTVKQLNQLRQIIVTKSRCPLILAGNADLLKTIMLPKTRRECESLDQFTSRLSWILNLDEMAGSKGDGGIYTTDDIRKLYEYGGIRLTADAVATLRKICKTPRTGRLRTCSHVISALHTERTVLQTKQIDARIIISAIEQLRLPVRVWLPMVTKDVAEIQSKKHIAAKAG